MKIREVKLQYEEVGECFEHEVIGNCRAVVEYMKNAIEFRADQEQAWVILLDCKLKPLGRFLCSLGTLDACMVHPREVFRAAIVGGAHSVILVHNHPSGDVEPSDADYKLTGIMEKSGDILGIPLVDHVIIGGPSQHGKYCRSILTKERR